jgi:general secretion pathway protein F
MTKLTIDELIALNDEIRGLVRAGIPLDHGLRLLGSDLPGRLGQLALSISESLERGESLTHVIDDPRHGLPRLYRSVVAAGLQSGRLAVALEGLSTTARQAAELRRTVIVSMIYPTFLIYLASGLLSFVALKTAPLMVRVYDQFGFALPTWYARIQLGLREAPLVLLLFWMAMIALLAVWLFWSGRATAIRANGLGIPSIARLKKLGRLATFSRVMALLIEHDVPLHEALRLAAESSGDRRLRIAGNTLIGDLQRGADRVTMSKSLPPLLAWQITNTRDHAQLARNLHLAADGYHRRAMRMGEWLSVYLPILFAGVFGGAIALAYGLIVIGPFYHLLILLS